MPEALCDFVHGDRVRLHLITDRRISSQTTSLAPNQVWESKANINLSPFKTIFFFPFFFFQRKKFQAPSFHMCISDRDPFQSQCRPPEPWSRQSPVHMWVLPLVWCPGAGCYRGVPELLSWNGVFIRLHGPHLQCQDSYRGDKGGRGRGECWQSSRVGLRRCRRGHAPHHLASM